MHRALGIALALSACGPAAVAPKAAPERSEQKPTPAAGKHELSALSARERGFVDELKKDVQELSVKLGERNVDKKWELAGAADFLAGELEGMGYPLGRQGDEIDGVAAQDLEVEIKGQKARDEIVIVGAHYDTAAGSPGADDNASGVAAALALARRFKSATPRPRRVAGSG